MKTLITFLALTSLLYTAQTIAVETIKLESIFVGDKEQPSVTYIMPWKPPEGPDKLYRPIDTVSQNILAPVDREVLLLSVQYYETMALEAKK